MTLLSKGAKVCKSFGTKHGEKIFQLGNRYYSFDNTQHNGGIYKVFEREGGNLKRIGTADKDLRIFKGNDILVDTKHRYYINIQ